MHVHCINGLRHPLFCSHRAACALPCCRPHSVADKLENPLVHVPFSPSQAQLAMLQAVLRRRAGQQHSIDGVLGKLQDEFTE